MSHNFCQSCGMPLSDPSLLGSEKDESKNGEYCKYCYKDGEFTNSGSTLEKMLQRLIGKMEEEKVPEDIIESTVKRLPGLKRWKDHFQVPIQ
jgi:uncharacterized protein CbrC (UPF0167 family)